MAMFDDVMTVSSDDDDELEVLSEHIVPAKSSMELTPGEKRRLLKQLNLDPNALVNIRVSGRGGRQRSLGLAVAQCKVVQEGKVIRQKSLQSHKIFGPAKKPPQDAALAAKFSEILTISDDESEFQLGPELSPFKKVTLSKKHKSNKLIDHLVQQQRAERGIQGDLEAVGCVITDEAVSQFEETFPDADTSKLTEKSIALSKSPNIGTKENHTVVTEASVQIESQEPEPAQRIQHDHPDLENQELSRPATLTTSQAGTIDEDTADHIASEAPLLVDIDSQILITSDLHKSSPEPSSRDEVDESELIEVQESCCVESTNEEGSEECLNIVKTADQMDIQESSTRSEFPELTQIDCFDNAPAESEVNGPNAIVKQADFESSQYQAASILESNNVDLIPSTEQQCDAISGQSEVTSLTLTYFQDFSADLVFHEADDILLLDEIPTKVSKNQSSSSEVFLQDSLCQENSSPHMQAKTVQAELTSKHGQVTSGPPSVSSINLTAGHLGQLFLPTGQLSQLFPPGTSVHDVMSVCTDLNEDLMWDGWAVSHVSLSAAIRVLDKYGDMFEVRDELIVKQQLAELEKTSLRMGTSRTSDDERNKKDLLSVMGLCRVEEVNAILEETNHMREVARSSTRLRSGSRRKQSPGEAFGGMRIRAGNLPRNTGKKSDNKGKGKRRK